MKTSIDLPDDLYRRVKARSAMEGRTVLDVATQLLAQWIDDSPTTRRPSIDTPGIRETAPVAAAAPAEWRYAWASLGARVTRVLAEHGPPHPAAGAASPDTTDRPGGLVDQLERDRR